MQYYRNLCETCGGTLEKVDDTHYACESCGNVYSIEKVENYADKLNKILDKTKLEMISNARKNLYAAVSAKYISKDEVSKWCDEIKKYLPDDFQANFYSDFINKPKREVAQMIRKIDVKEQFELLEPIIIFLAKSLEKSYVAATKDLVERTYKLYKSDMEKYVKYITMVEDEAEKLDKCVYDTKQPRKAFVAYSSKDSDKAIELVEVLEAQGISCFISLRNLRHGVGSQENYDKALKEAMDSCTSFVFVSSMNSRNIECDAYNIEIPYVMQNDKNNAPGNLRNYYTRIPNEYKKPRVEYRIQESVNENAADELVDEFFDGYERVYTANDVAKRVLRQSVGVDIPVSAPQNKTENTVKFCVSCLSENTQNASKCTECGGIKFAADLNAVAQIRKQEKEEKIRIEAEKRRQEAEKRKKEEEQRRKQEEENRKRAEEAAKRRREAEEAEKRRREAEEARRKREAELALIAEEERKKRRKKIGILSVVAIILILTILFVWVDPLVRHNQSDNSNNNSETINGVNITTNVNGLISTNKSTDDNNIAEDNTVDPNSRVGEKITFGSYPQTKVTDESLTATLNAKAGTLPTSENSQAWISYKYYIEGNESDFMWYIDVEESDEKYRGVYFTLYRPYDTINSSSSGYSNQDNNGYTINIVYWFKYEPISWTILSEDTSNETALVFCDNIIDSREYYITDSGTRTIDHESETVYPNNYAYSVIRKWLNETFYNISFNEIEKQIILTKAVYNNALTTDSETNKYACKNTADKIFLLSYQNVTNSNNNSSSNFLMNDTVLQKNFTDYARVQGGARYWWLRSPNSDSPSKVYVIDGSYNKANTGRSVVNTSCGVVPAMQIKLSELN